MIAYFDTSAFVPLLVEEPSTSVCREVWGLAEIVVASRILYVEVSAAVCRAHRLDRIDADGRRRGLDRLDDLWAACFPIELDEGLALRARRCSEIVALRGYDAVHCASGLLINDEPDAVLVSGDRELLAAWRYFGARVLDINATTN